MTDNDLIIRTEELTKVYDGVRAVDSLDLKVRRGDVFGFLGPNGAGKSTTIGMIAGLVEPSEGKCYVNGIDVTRAPIEAKKITGYLPDGAGFYPNLTPKQNLKFFSKIYDMKEKDANARIIELLDYVGLGKADKPVGGFSRGMKQRLGLAQALLNDPEIVLLDEPTNGLDPRGVIQFRKIIKELAENGKTVFFSSHILEEVRQVCNTIGIISAGKLVAQGSLEEVRRQMHGDDSYTIIVRTMSPMPKISDPRIVNAVYNNGSAVIEAREDIRDDISMELRRKDVGIRELMLKDRSLEEIFLETVYGGE